MKNVLLLILGIAIGALIMYFVVNKSDVNLEVNAPKGLITAAQAKTLDAAFNSRHTLISDSIVKRKGGDNRSSWYHLEQMRDYLNYAEDKAKERGYAMDGIRVYLGANSIENGEAGYTTMFFIPTGKRMNSEASVLKFNMQDDGGDIPDAEGLDMGTVGHPPSANYPQ